MSNPEPERLAVLEATVEELRIDVKELVNAWKAANSLVKFIKLLATIATALSAIYFFVTHGFAPPKVG